MNESSTVHVPNATFVQITCHRKHRNARTTKLLASPSTSALYKAALTSLQGTVVSHGKDLQVQWFGHHTDTLSIVETQPRATDSVLITTDTVVAFIPFEPMPSNIEFPTSSTSQLQLQLQQLQLHQQPDQDTMFNHLRTSVRGLDSQLHTLISAWYQRDRTDGIAGILLRGAPGSGKTLAVDALGQCIRRMAKNEEENANCITLQTSTLFKKEYGEGERMLVNTIDRAVTASSSVLIVLDEIDLLGSSGNSGSNGALVRPGEQDSDAAGVDPTATKMLRLLCALLDDLYRNRSNDVFNRSRTSNVLVIGVTNNYDGMRPSVLEELTAAGRLSTVVECTIPNVKQRYDMLELLTSRVLLNKGNGRPENTLQDLAVRTPGMVGSDLADLCREAAMSALSREHTQDNQKGNQPEGNQPEGNQPEGNQPEGNQPEEGQKEEPPLSPPPSLLITPMDWSNALAVVRPSGLRSTVHSTTLPESTPTLKHLKLSAKDPVRRVISTTLSALESPEKWYSKGVSPPSGLLLYGPSGNGKTLLASALAKEVQRRGLGNVIVVRCTDIVRSILGASERALTKVFARARRMQPCVVVLDQIEAIGKARGHDDTNERTWDRLLSCLLIELDGMRTNNVATASTDVTASSQDESTSRGVYVIGTTCDLSLLDPALVRPGRFDDCIYVGPPTPEERKHLLLEGMKSAASRSPHNEQLLSSLDQMVIQTRDWSRAELNGLCREAIMEAIRENDQHPCLAPVHFFHLLDRYQEGGEEIL